MAPGKTNFQTGVPFLDTWMDQIARHGMVDLDVMVCGWRLGHIDDQSTRRRCGITMGQGVR